MHAPPGQPAASAPPGPFSVPPSAAVSVRDALPSPSLCPRAGPRVRLPVSQRKQKHQAEIASVSWQVLTQLHLTRPSPLRTVLLRQDGARPCSGSCPPPQALPCPTCRPLVHFPLSAHPHQQPSPTPWESAPSFTGARPDRPCPLLPLRAMFPRTASVSPSLALT